MKKNLISALSLSILAFSTSALSSLDVNSSELNFESFQLKNMVVDTKEVPIFTVKLRDRFASQNLVLNSNVRNSIKNGVNYSPLNTDFDMPSNSQVIDAIKELERVYNMTGLELYVVDSYNGFQEVAIMNPEENSAEELLNTLESTGIFENIEYFRFSRNQGSEKVLAENSQQYSSNDGGVGALSVINTGAFNDTFYPEQTHFGRQSYNSLAAHSFEEAIRLLNESGSLSGRKINIAVIDTGFFEHEDINYVQTKDFSIAPHTERHSDLYDGNVYLNKNNPVIGEDIVFSSSVDVGCTGEFLDQNGNVIDDSEDATSSERAEFCFSNFSDAQISLLNPEYVCKSDYGCNLEDWVAFENDGRAILYSDTHSLEVGGLIAARSNNDQGITGIIPHNNVNLVNAGSLINGGGVNRNTNRAVLWSAGLLNHPDILPSEYPADIINMSLGGGGLCAKMYDVTDTTGSVPSSAMAKMLYENGVLLVAAAGNDSVDHYATSPSACSYGVSVGALDGRGTLASFSNHGSDLDVMAYGEGVITSTIGIQDSDNERISTLLPLVDNANSFSAYGAVNGTSFSAPIVTGLAGLLKLADPSLEPRDIIEIINNTATRMDDNGDCYFTGCGNGSINAEKAVRFVLNGEMLRNVEAKHFLTDSDIAINPDRLAHLAQYGDVCGRYKITNGINVQNGDFEYTLHGSNGDGYNEIGVYHRSEFIFADDYSSYGVSVRNLSTGAQSDIERVDMDRGYQPPMCD